MVDIREWGTSNINGAPFPTQRGIRIEEAVFVDMVHGIFSSVNNGCAREALLAEGLRFISYREPGSFKMAWIVFQDIEGDRRTLYMDPACLQELCAQDVTRLLPNKPVATAAVAGGAMAPNDVQADVKRFAGKRIKKEAGVDVVEYPLVKPTTLAR